MTRKEKNEYLKNLNAQVKKTKGKILLESPSEIVDSIIGLELFEFEVLSGKRDEVSDEAWCTDVEIFMSFQGKEMRIYINEEGQLCVYTD